VGASEKLGEPEGVRRKPGNRESNRGFKGIPSCLPGFPLQTVREVKAQKVRRKPRNREASRESQVFLPGLLVSLFKQFER